MRSQDYCVALVTAPDLKTARRLAKRILTLKSAACINLIPKMESHYWWKNKLERGNEVLLLIKTAKKSLPELEKQILEIHPYDTPELITLPISFGNKRYLNWLEAALR